MTVLRKLAITLLLTGVLVLPVAGCASEAEDYYRQGLIMLENGQYGRAVTEFNRAVGLSPDYYQAFNDRGVCYARMGDYESALNDFNTAFGQDINGIQAFYNRDAAYRLLAGDGGAMDDLRLCRDALPLPEYARADNGGHLPLLLVHGFQATSFDPNELWAEMALYFTGLDVDGGEALAVTVTGRDGDPDTVMLRLEGRGYVVYISNYTRYPEKATRGDVRRYARNLADEITLICGTEGCDEVDIITHSSGGLVARAYVENKDFPENPFPVSYRGDVRKLIMLATPNHGTYLGDILPDTLEEYVEWESWEQVEVASPFLQRLNGGLTGRQQGVEYWALAGNAYRCAAGIKDPAALALCMVSGQKDNDGAVTVESVYLPGQGDFEEIPPQRWFTVNLAHIKLRCQDVGYIVEYMLNGWEKD
jgi:tetratricopeptide repeat protein